MVEQENKGIKRGMLNKDGPLISEEASVLVTVVIATMGQIGKTGGGLMSQKQKYTKTKINKQTNFT